MASAPPSNQACPLSTCSNFTATTHPINRWSIEHFSTCIAYLPDDPKPGLPPRVTKALEPAARLDSQFTNCCNQPSMPSRFCHRLQPAPPAAAPPGALNQLASSNSAALRSPSSRPLPTPAKRCRLSISCELPVIDWSWLDHSARTKTQKLPSRPPAVARESTIARRWGSLAAIWCRHGNVCARGESQWYGDRAGHRHFRFSTSGFSVRWSHAPARYASTSCAAWTRVLDRFANAFGRHVGTEANRS